MTTFKDFITKPVSKKVALLEAEPGLHLDFWTLDSGAIYYADFSELIINEPAIISQVNENGAVLTQKASKGEMVQGSWYQDVAAGKLYVRCSDDGDPNAKVMVAYFKIYFGTEELIFNEHFYQGRIPEGGISLMAAGEVIDGGEIVLLNGDGWFDKRMADWLWRGVRATLLLGGDNLAYSDYEKICNLRVQGMSWEDGAVRMSLKGAKVDLRRRLPINEVYTDKKILRPNGQGYYTAWDWDYNKIKEEVADGDTSYIRTAGGGLPKESFTLDVSSIPEGATIEYLALYIRGRKELDKDGRIRPALRIGTTDYISYPGNRWDTKYQTKVNVWPVNPDTGTSWTKAAIQALEAMVEGDVKTENQGLRVTQVYGEVSISQMRGFDEGKPMAIVLGEGELTPVLENQDYKKGKFRVADGTLQSLKAIEWVKYEDVEIPAEKLEKNLTDCWFAIETTWDGMIKDPANVRCKVKGAVRQDIPGIESDTTMITCASDMLRFILGVMGYDENDLDITSFKDSKNANQECKLFITGLTYAEDVINWLRQSVHGLFGQNREGKIYFKLWTEDATGALVIDCDREALEFRVLERQGPVCDRAICKYGKDADTGKWLFASEADGNARYLYSQTETRAFETALKNKGDAEDEAHEFLTSHRPAPMECEVVVKLQAAKIEVGDKVKLTRERAPDGTGSWTEKIFQVKEVQREPGNRIRLLLESNLPCLDYQLKGFEEAENPDAQEGMQRALAVIGRSGSFVIKADKKVEGKTPVMGTVVDKVEGAIEDSNYKIKTDKVIATSIVQDEALRKDSVSAVQIAANSAKAVAHGKTYPVHFVVGMFSSGSQNIYELKSFNDLTDFLTGWKIVIYCTGIMPHQENDGDMEKTDVNDWTAINGAVLSKVTDPVYEGNRALKVEIGAGKTYGAAEQIIAISPGPSGSADCYSVRCWARNGNATKVKLKAWAGTPGDEYNTLLGEVESTDNTKYVELTLLRKSVPHGKTRIAFRLRVEGTAGQYGYFDNVKASYPDSSVVIKQISGTTKDFKVRAFLEQAGT